jgi:undecaprenyl-diphosphatase
VDLFHAIILGIVEGITEFLPISSTGHLILASDLLGIEETEFVKTFQIVIQSGAILSVICLYRRIFFPFFYPGDTRNTLDARGAILRVLVAFIPTAVTGFILYEFIKKYLIGNAEVVLLSLFLGGIVLIAVELFFRNMNHESRIKENGQSSTINSQLSYEKAFVIGLFQSVAMIPGVSRAAATIIGGLLVGLPRKTAVEFSFLLAVPTMLAATTLDLIQTSFAFNLNQWTVLAVGFITSFIVALIAIQWLLKFIQTNTFIPFGIYRIALSVLYFFLILN